jgi:hypothetical protein
MLIAGVLCVCAAVVSAGFGTWSLSHSQTANSTATTGTNALALRAMAPTQLAAAVMLAAGGVVALVASPHTALVLVIVCVAGALGTLAAGSWQSARFALRREATEPNLKPNLKPNREPNREDDCEGNCAGCTLSCR